MTYRPTRRVAMALMAACLHATAAIAAPEAAWSALKDGSIVLLRHADAPGIGDPANFKLDDCSTQRNLGDKGREQARRIGTRFREKGISVGRVLTSQWCRTRDTAMLAFPGQGRDDPAFNSFFGDAGSEPRQTATALATLAGWRGPGVLVVVTHQVNITALTGVVPASGEAVVLRPKGQGVEVVGRID